MFASFRTTVRYRLVHFASGLGALAFGSAVAWSKISNWDGALPYLAPVLALFLLGLSCWVLAYFVWSPRAIELDLDGLVVHYRNRVVNLRWEDVEVAEVKMHKRDERTGTLDTTGRVWTLRSEDAVIRLASTDFAPERWRDLSNLLLDSLRAAEVRVVMR